MQKELSCFETDSICFSLICHDIHVCPPKRVVKPDLNGRFVFPRGGETVQLSFTQTGLLSIVICRFFPEPAIYDMGYKTYRFLYLKQCVLYNNSKI